MDPSFSLESHSVPNTSSLLSDEERAASHYESVREIHQADPSPVRLTRDLSGRIAGPQFVVTTPRQNDLSGHTHYTPSWIWDKRKQLRDYDFPGTARVPHFLILPIKPRTPLSLLRDPRASTPNPNHQHRHRPRRELTAHFVPIHGSLNMAPRGTNCA
eukprot:3074962-Pyramimonas_sp.AAC.2